MGSWSTRATRRPRPSNSRAQNRRRRTPGASEHSDSRRRTDPPRSGSALVWGSSEDSGRPDLPARWARKTLEDSNRSQA
eukprot:14064579-Alexandrium_andersonii.AAC.1